MRTKRSRTRRRLGIVAVTAGMVALSACAGGAGGADAGDEADSPLKEYLGYSPFDTGNGGGPGFVATGARSSELTMMAAPAMPLSAGNDEQREKQNRKVENMIATCMEKQGFSYVPYVPDEQDTKTPWDKAMDLPPEKFAERWGYGIATMADMTDTAEPPGSEDDPNKKIYQKLSKSAQKAYDKALYGAGRQGTMVVFDGESGPGETGRTLERGGGAEEDGDKDGGKKKQQKPTPGCAAQAHQEVFDDQAPDMEKMSSFDSLFEDVRTLTERLGRDPKVVEANAEWSDCMADAGHGGHNSPKDARRSIEQKLSELYDQKNPEAGMDKLADQEIELATADHECASQGLDDVRAEVAQKLEEEFVSDHETELERYRDFRTEQHGGADGKGEQESGN